MLVSGHGVYVCGGERKGEASKVIVMHTSLLCPLLIGRSGASLRDKTRKGVGVGGVSHSAAQSTSRDPVRKFWHQEPYNGIFTKHSLRKREVIVIDVEAALKNNHGNAIFMLTRSLRM